LETYGIEEFADSELNYIAGVLEQDAKNYHAWSFRQWAIQAINKESVWEKEVEYGET
jgi:protein farnesyltransferase/geranylgeranyltransferase type-1 subunit alpha